MHGPGECRNGYELGRIALEAFGLARIGCGAEFHRAAKMVDAGGGAKQERCAVLLGQEQTVAGHVLGFLSRGRFQNRHACDAGIVAVVLLVLAGVAARIVGGQQYDAAGGACITKGHERVGSHVDAYVLHCAQGHGSGQSCSAGHLKGDLFVDRIFEVVLPSGEMR